MSGDEEAALTRRGVATGRAVAPGTAVLDIGGGSTELVSERFRASLDIGCVRLTERFLTSDPPTRAELNDARHAVRELLARHVADAAIPAAVGVAGTVTTLAALDLGLIEYDADRIDGHRLGARPATEQPDRLAALPLEERRRVPGLEPERAPVIVAGAIILAELLAFLGLEEIAVSERDILHGIALEAAALPAREEGNAPPGAYTCC